MKKYVIARFELDVGCWLFYCVGGWYSEFASEAFAFDINDKDSIPPRGDNEIFLPLDEAERLTQSLLNQR
jgi:hypothetical protein